ncbi:MAG: aldose epimerase family protein [Pseudomonadota bacterium]
MPITRQLFGKTREGFPVDLYILSNKNNLAARIMTYGGTLASLCTPDREGNIADIILGFDDLSSYLDEHPYFGSLIGRYANRIAGGIFRLNDTGYRLAQNNGPNHLHGGKIGFDKVMWDASPCISPNGPQLTLNYLSHAGEEGYPGDLNVQVVYTLTDNDELQLDYTATTNQTTVINLTNHTYFNLAGNGTILNHIVQLAAERFLPVDETLIPTGELRSVQGTPMDFTKPVAIGEFIKAEDNQLQYAKGYDHNWILTKNPNAMAFAARVYEETSGRELTLHTTQPGIQFYTGNLLDGTLRGKNGKPYAQYSGFCLETQHFPDSPNHPTFPSTVLTPNDQYRHTTVYRFAVRS